VAVTDAKNTLVRKRNISHTCDLFEIRSKITAVFIFEREAVSCLF